MMVGYRAICCIHKRRQTPRLADIVINRRGSGTLGQPPPFRSWPAESAAQAGIYKGRLCSKFICLAVPTFWLAMKPAELATLPRTWALWVYLLLHRSHPVKRETLANLPYNRELMTAYEKGKWP